MDIQEVEKELSTVISEYYYCYNLWRSTPHISSELLGMECDSQIEDEYCNMCCAISLEVFKEIVALLEIRDDQTMEFFLVDKQYRCSKNKLPLSRSERLLVAETGGLFQSTRKEMAVCLFLVAVLFTSEYQMHPENLAHLVRVFKCYIHPERRNTHTTVAREDTVELKKHLAGEVDIVSKNWLTMVDQGCVLFHQYTQKRKISGAYLSNLLNLDADTPEDIYDYVV